MDIFNYYSTQAIHEYLSEYLESQDKPPFLYLDRKRTECTEAVEREDCAQPSNEIGNEIRTFYRMAGNPNPFYYYSKLRFVMEHLTQDLGQRRDAKSIDLLLRLISDRCLYFYEHRRYACSDGGLHTLIERERMQRTCEEHHTENVKVRQELEPLTQTHLDYYHEYLHNYQALNHALINREKFIKVSGLLVDELNQLGRKTKVSSEACGKAEGVSFIIGERKESIKAVVQSYVASVIWRTRKDDCTEKFQQIFVWKEKDSVEAFEKGILSIVNAITLPDGKLHCLSPYVLYNIFTSKTQALLEGDSKRLWKNVYRCSKLAAVSSMTELTGRKAGVNLALWCELSHSFRGSNSSFDNLFTKLNLCCDPSIAKEDMQRQQQGLLDFLFYLTTGYGALYHCQPRHYQIKKPLSEICECDSGDSECRLFLYSPDYQHPVDDLWYLIKSNIEACFANRPEFLTPTVHMPQSRMELAKLADLLLQDMALPAADRLSRLIQKNISENPQILEQYRPCLYEFKESCAVMDCLQKIMDTYFSDLDCLMMRYHDLETRYGYYDYRRVLRAMVEYEIRHLLNEEGKEVLRTVAKRILPKSLFVNQNFV